MIMCSGPGPVQYQCWFVAWPIRCDVSVSVCRARQVGGCFGWVPPHLGQRFAINLEVPELSVAVWVYSKALSILRVIWLCVDIPSLVNFHSAWQKLA